MALCQKPLSQTDRLEIFRLATRGLSSRYANNIAAGMHDAELCAVLEDILGIFGGCCGPGRLSVTYQGSGLKIWGGWHIVNHITEEPLYTGARTVAMARQVLGIANPGDAQMQLF
ncbi:MAG: hypothetical protein K8F59_17005 [Rhodobacteraceae bacterium]|nr:hypothetical protein [Paracoccaceae bacterium]